MAYNYGYNNQNILPIGGGVGNLSFGGTYNTNQGYVTSPMAVPVPAPSVAPVYDASAVSTMGTSLAPDIASLGGGDALSAAMVGTGAFNEGTNGALVNVAEPGAAPFNMGGMFKSTFLNENGGLNVGNIASLLGSIGSIYGAMQSYGLAKDSLDFSKETFKTNLANQTKSYNTALEDRARSRYSQEGGSQSDADDYVRKNRL